ncbi:MAG: SDR family NAD(P)-dependent oxidoreductase [Ruminococcaceae bacterium]|nr:SDR family NAD(P)-dependent oxidoreductase [Oscillospiraceae bacterium]
MSIEKWLKKNTSSLSGKTVAITGSTGGLGAPLCAYLSRLGASLILVDRNKSRSEAHASELREKYGATVSLIQCDLQSGSSVIKATEELIKAEPDILIHNAGAYSIPRETCDTGYGNVFQINFLSPYYITKKLLPTLRKKNGRVIAVGSIAHNYSKTDPNDIDFVTRKASSKLYGNAKRFLMFSLYTLFENEKDVTLSVVHPGITFTNITAHYPKVIFAIIKHPMKIIFMKPKKAALCLLRGLFDSTIKNEWIGPHLFNVWGYPSKKLLKTCKNEEISFISDQAEKAYRKMCGEI